MRWGHKYVFNYTQEFMFFQKLKCLNIRYFLCTNPDIFLMIFIFCSIFYENINEKGIYCRLIESIGMYK